MFGRVCGEGLEEGFTENSHEQETVDDTPNLETTYIRSECCDSRVYDCAAEAFCVTWSNSNDVWLSTS